MTDATVSDVLSELQAQESRELAAARDRYWKAVHKLAADSTALSEASTDIITPFVFLF